ncbi:Hypothetical protein R9X50_00571600 [Acrodontium crateriforme]|uniref:N-acetyltransferase domain-containing protein n=1 Tax=Acrodontium crateriforme TaxID=150365 RepID=A0AAQ3RDC2_9PEZI|nr:Hypothetical protein R9X50_00571600 [Acrodontium crateriforme]
MAVTIKPLEENEISTFVRIELEAFRPHPRTAMMWPRGYTDDLYAFYEANKLKSFHDPTAHFMKAMDDQTGQVAAVSEWTFALDPVVNANKPRTDPNGQPPANWPVAGNWALRRFFKIEFEKFLHDVLGGKPYILLDILCVEPKFQGRGAGSQLLKWGTEQADARGIHMCLESTPDGLTLYTRFGFVQRRIIDADMKEFGYNDPYSETAAVRYWMVREPRVEQ